MRSSWRRTMPERLRLVRRDGENGVALLLVIFLMFIAIALATAIVGVVVSQAPQTQLSDKEVRTIAASEAGLQAGLTAVRSANNGLASGSVIPVGDITKLPCSVASSSAPATVGADTETYYVTITYYDADPTSYVDELEDTSSSASQVTTAEAWLNNTANQVYCSPTAGTQIQAGYAAMATPSYSVITSFGGAAPLPHQPVGSTFGNRTTELVYNIQSNNTNIPGGPVAIYQASGYSGTQYCLDAGASPVAGEAVTMQVCNTGYLGQLWQYNPLLQLQLSETITGGAAGLCLDDPTQTAEDAAVLEPCSTTNPATYTQEWSFNDVAQFQNATSGGALGSLCLELANPQQTGSLVIAGSVCGDGYSNQWAWDPSASVGAGAAEGEDPNDPSNPPIQPAQPSATGTPIQLVNYYEFGRCLDISDQNVAAPDLIDFPCKQDPLAADVAWNQKFNWNPTTGQFWTVYNGSDYCMNSPGTATATSYVTFSACPISGSGTPSNEVWQLTENNGVYLTSYEVIDYKGNCLTLGPPDGTWDSNLLQWSSIVTYTCNPSTPLAAKTGIPASPPDLADKWDAPANLITGGSHDEVETNENGT
jgi:hypothetical protein